MTTQTRYYDILKSDGKRLTRVGYAEPTRKGTGLRLSIEPEAEGEAAQTLYLMPARHAPDISAQDAFDNPFWH